MGTENRQVSKTDTSERLSEGALSKHMLCNQTFELFTSLRNWRPFRCICCINFGVGEAELMENEGLYFGDGGWVGSNYYWDRQTS